MDYKLEFKTKRESIFLATWTYCSTAVLLGLLFSPYAKHNEVAHRVLIENIEINAPAEQVYHFLSNSNTASEWSAFVDHITPLNEANYSDGEKGSTRRCFQNADESGFQWDEEIVFTKKNRKRRLSIYNIKDFPITTEQLMIEQIYQEINENCCRLSLSLFLKSENSTWFDGLKLYFTSYQIASIFKENLQNIKESMRVTTNNIVELFLAAAAKHPENVAIIEGDKKITYSALEKEVKATAAYFVQKNIGSGDRVLVFLPMGIDLYRVVLALFYIGATVVFLDEWVSKKRMEVCCQLADCKGFIGVFKARIFAFFSKELRQIPITLSLRKRSQESLPVADVFSDSAALITFTTGSTGTPKAARRSHEFLQNQFDALLEEIQPKVSDVGMPVLPIVLFVNLGVGCTSVIADFKMTKPESMRPQHIAAQIKRYKVNRITASPFFVDRLAKHTIDNKTPLIGIEKVFTGGAPVFPKKAASYPLAFPKAKSTIVYGSTEAEPISSIDAVELSNKLDLPEQGLPVGPVFHQTNLKIIRITEEPIQADGESIWKNLQLADGEVGEIIVAGPHVLKQYFRNDAAFQQNKIVVGHQIWHRTGDSGFIKDQTLFLTGRCQQLIHQKGEFLSPFIFENQLQSIEGVVNGTLIEIKEQVILAIQSHLSLDQLEQIFSGIPYDQIRKISQIPLDPRHHTKIDYALLSKMLLST